MDAVLGFFAGLGVAFVFGSLSFWLTLAVVFGLLTWFTETHCDRLAAFLLVAFVVFVAAANDLSIALNPWVWVKYIAIYVVIGSLYSFLKWTSYLFKMRDELKELKTNFVENYNARIAGGKAEIKLIDGKIPTDMWDAFTTYINERYYSSPFHGCKKPEDFIPSVQKNVGNLTRWIVWWPFSAFWTFLSDPLTRLARLIIETFRGVYDKIARGIFADEV